MLHKVYDTRPVEVEDFVTVDSNVDIECDNVDIIIGEVSPSDEIESAESEEEKLEESKINSTEEAIVCIRDVCAFSKRNNDYGAFELLKKVEMHFEDILKKERQAKLVQKKISDFFK